MSFIRLRNVPFTLFVKIAGVWITKRDWVLSEVLALFPEVIAVVSHTDVCMYLHLLNQPCIPGKTVT